MDLLKLDIGSGSFSIPGFLGWDIKNGAAAFPLPLRDGSVAEIRASHVLEHLLFADAERALAEWSRVLVDGGRVRIAVPDMRKVAECLDSDPLALRYAMGGQTDEHDVHRSAWTRETLAAAMDRAGFDVDADAWVSEVEDCASLAVSLNVSGVKRKSAGLRVCALLNVPRLGWQEHFGCLHEAVGALGIPIRRTSGVFWDQCMTRALSEAREAGFDWAITTDYDSVFGADHVRMLLSTMFAHDEIDALAAMQTRRCSDKMLMQALDGEGRKELTANVPLQVASAHFGLTILRLDRLDRLEKPWFIHVPDDEGGYGEGRCDADVVFWKRWRAAGLNVSVLPACSIGHLEVFVSHFNIWKNRVERDYVHDWADKMRAGWGVREMPEKAEAEAEETPESGEDVA